MSAGRGRRTRAAGIRPKPYPATTPPDAQACVSRGRASGADGTEQDVDGRVQLGRHLHAAPDRGRPPARRAATRGVRRIRTVVPLLGSDHDPRSTDTSMRSDSDLRILLLGPLEVRRCGELVPVPAGGQRTVLAALALAGGDVVDLETLTDLLWAGNLPENPRSAVQQIVVRLRRSLGATTVRT